MNDGKHDVGDAFGKLLAREPDEAERAKLYRVRDALGVRDNDALWLILMALGHYETLYEKFPGLIARAAKDALTDFRVEANAVAKASIESSKDQLTRSVARMALDLSRTMNAQRPNP